MVGIGGVIDGVTWTNNEGHQREYDITIGSFTHVNAYTAALAATEVGVGLVAHALCMGDLSPRVQGQTIHVFTNIRTVLTALQAPIMRSGQAIICKILYHTESLRKLNDRVIFIWAPASPIFELGQRARRLARDATEDGREIQGRVSACEDDSFDCTASRGKSERATTDNIRRIHT